jgi:hypothetical protein
MSPALPAQTAPPSVVNGFYSGSYVCGSVITRFDVTLTASPNGALAATFTVYPADGSGSFTYDLKGGYNPQFGNFNLQPQKKEGVTPPVSLVGMTGRFIPEGGLISGTMLLGRCGSYTATRHPPGTPAPAPKAAPSLPAAPTTPDPKSTPIAPTASAAGRQRPPPPPELNKVDAPMEIQLFDRMLDIDQIRYVTELQAAVRAVAKPDQLVLVNRFFQQKQPGEDLSGMGRFELRMAHVRITDIEVAQTNPKAPRALVDDQMTWALERSGIALTPAPAVRNFQRNFDHLQNPLSLDNARKTLVLVDADAHRNVGPPTDAELEHPRDATWTDRLGFEEPQIVRALYTGDFSLATHYRSQVLGYISIMNQQLQSHCPNLFDLRVSDQAGTEIGVRTILRMQPDLPAGGPTSLATRPSGNPLDLTGLTRQALIDAEDGRKDAEILYARVPFKCDSGIFHAIQKNMGVFVGVH